MQHELIIIGAGPAAYTASVYASRYKIKHILIGEAWGGLMAEAHKICNYPSEIEISGMELMQKMHKHVQALGAEIIMDKVVEIREKIDGFWLKTQNSQQEFTARTLLLTTGTQHRKLNLPGEDKLLGKGVSYCATCDAMFYKGKRVAVIGGSNSANTAALYLAEVAEKVFQIYRGEQLRGETVWVEQVQANDKIEVIYQTQVTALLGEEKLTGIKLDRPYQGKQELAVDGLFVEIGSEPDITLAKQLKLSLDEYNYIKVQPDQATNIKGVWAAGDVTNASNNLRQIVTACAEGAIAAESIFKYLTSQK